MKRLTKGQIKAIANLLQEGKSLPEEYKESLFQSKKEYELVYGGKAREEDIIAETTAAPLQPIKAFGDSKPGERANKLIFGDNLQALKYLYEEQQAGRLDKIDLIYIDPPFGTGDIYTGRGGQSAYSAKLQDVKFIDHLRKRLVLLRALLANGGSFYIRIDYHFGHYMKVVLDEVFGKENFRNELVINRFKRQLKGLNQFNVATDSLYLYSKTNYFHFRTPKRPRTCSFCGAETEPQWRAMSSPGLRHPPERKILGRVLLPPKGRHWTYIQTRIDQLTSEGRIRINKKVAYTDLKGKKVEGMPEYLQEKETPVDSDWTDLKGYVFGATYPTENPEELLERVIQSSSKEGDLVLDAYAGSGTTGAVAEKLGRRWIMIDSSKLALYTMQKRLLNLKVRIGNKGRPLTPKPLTIYNAGLYDYKLVRNLPWEEYREFALKLFQCREEEHTVSGIRLDGYLGADHVQIFRWRNKEEFVMDRGYIDDLHKTLGERIGKQMFVIAPTASVLFFEDYIQRDGTKYFILRIPDSIIEEINKRGFERLKQPIRLADINDVVDSVGFDFIVPPEVKCEYKITKSGGGQMKPREGHKQAVIKIKKFESKVLGKEAQEFKDLETLSMVMIDYDYDGEVFDIDDYGFAEEIAKNDHEIRFDPQKVGKQMMIIYMDIFGNEKREIKKLKEFK